MLISLIKHFICINWRVGGYLLDNNDDNGSDRFRICQKLWETVQMNTEVTLHPSLRLQPLYLLHLYVRLLIRFCSLINIYFFTGNTRSVK